MNPCSKLCSPSKDRITSEELSGAADKKKNLGHLSRDMWIA